MAYVQRTGGYITGSSKWPNEMAPEEVSDDDPDLLAYLAHDPDQPWPPILADVQIWAKAEVDRRAERARDRWITAGSGQALVYQAKRGEAEAWAADSSPRTLADYPFMLSRAARLNRVSERAVTVAQMQAIATEWTAKAESWRDAGIAIEAAREQAKEEIDAAVDATAVQAVVDDLTWPEPA